MIFYNASCPFITYVGNWEDNQKSKKAKNNFCKCFFMFKGSSICISATGNISSSLDGEKETGEKNIKTSDGVHSLFITVEKGCVLDGFEAIEIIDTAKYLKEQMLDEFNQISLGRTILNKTEWKNIPYKSVAPEKSVKLNGFYGDLFKRNKERIKRCFKERDFIEDDNGNPNEKRGWSGWFPAANDGRVLGGAAKILCWENDNELEGIVSSVVEKIKTNIRDDGYFGYYPEEKIYSSTPDPDEKDIMVKVDSERKNYDRVWWTYAMIAAYKSGNKSALPIVRKMYDWLENSRWCKDLIKGNNSTNSLMGSLYLAETPLGTTGDIEFNLKFLNQQYYEKELALKNPAIFDSYPGNRPHCYELLELLSLAYEYRMTGNSDFLDALLGGWEVYKKYYKNIGGATAISETAGPFPPGSYYITNNETGESCGSVFWIWLNQELAQLYPDKAEYHSEIEEALFNIIPAAFTPEGTTRYHNRMQGVKEPGRRAGTCCELMTTFLLSELPKYMFTYNKNTVWINQFISYSADIEDIAFDVNADILDLHKFTITISKASQKDKTIKIRIPEWAENAEISVNGSVLDSIVCDSYATINRVWAKHDVVMVKFTPALKRVIYTGAEQAESENEKYALLYGPYLMAVVGDYEGDVPVINGVKIKDFSCSKSQTSFEIVINKTLKYVPYFEIGDNVKFSCFPEYEE